MGMRAPLTRREAHLAMLAGTCCVHPARADAERSAVPRGAELGRRGMRPSAIIRGCWQLSGGHGGERSSDRTRGLEAVSDLKDFAKNGIDTFDTGPEACGYGPSEEIIGQYMRERKEDVQVYTKMCCVGREMYDMNRDWVKRDVIRHRNRLNVDKLDLVQLYWNDYEAKDYVSTVLYLMDERERGKVGEIGVTNFDVPRLEKMVDAGAEIVSNQIQYSLLDRRPELRMNEFCRATGMKLLPYGVVAGGFLSDRYLRMPANKVKLDTNSKRKYASVLNQVGSYDWLQELLYALREVGDKYDQSIANVASRWVLQKDTVGAIIVGARNPRHIDDHQKVFNFELQEDDLKYIQEILNKGKLPKGDCYAWERGLGPF